MDIKTLEEVVQRIEYETCRFEMFTASFINNRYIGEIDGLKNAQRIVRNMIEEANMKTAEISKSCQNDR